jgi:cytochrome c biogenesis protein CcmG, thiol:disulfide interchange protein DsbE
MILRLCATVLALVAGNACAATAKVGTPAPQFRVKSVTKQTLDLQQLRGQVVVVNRWATWCVPCRAEFALFEAYAKLRSKNGLTIIAIETGGAGNSGPMRALAESVHFPVVLETGARASGYPILKRAVPTNYVIDRAGVVRYAKEGAFELQELDAVVRPLLNEPAPVDAPAPQPQPPST